MSTLEDLDDLEREQKEEKKDDKNEGGDGDKGGKKNDGDAEMKDAEPAEEEEEVLDDEILSLGTRDIVARKRLLENDMRIMRSEYQRLTHEKASMMEKIRDNLEKIENNRCVLFCLRHLLFTTNVTWSCTDHA
jgi:26S proteasome regulatory subunit T5